MSSRLLFAALVLLSGYLTLASGRGAAPAIAAPSNLVTNGGFESKAAGWQLCGGAGIADAQRAGKLVAASGRYAARIGNPTRGTCPTSDDWWTEDVREALYQTVTIPGATSALTLSFWYYVDARVGGSLEVGLAPNVYDGSSSDNSVFLYGPSSVEQPGWQEVRRTFSGSELQRLKGHTLKLVFRLLYPLTLAERQTFRLDDVRLVPAAVRTAITTRPPAALKGDGSRPIAFVRSELIDGLTWRNLWVMDTDGTKTRRLYTGILGDTGDPSGRLPARRSRSPTRRSRTMRRGAGSRS